MVALRRYARYEQRLADALRTRRDVLTEAADDAALARLFALQPGTLDRQALAAWTVLRQRLTLVTGGPDTGKTTTVARMLALLAARPRASSEEHTYELPSLMRISYAAFRLKKKKRSQLIQAKRQHH